MLKRFTPSPAMAVALLALFVALAGGAYAQTNLPANSVGTAQLRNGAVNHPKLAANSVWHANIGRHSARNINLAANSVWNANIGRRSVQRINIANHAVGAAQLDIQAPWLRVGSPNIQTPFQNGWHNAGLGPSPTPAGFTEVANCVVYLRGQVAGGTVSPNASSSTVFTLPFHFRPVGGQRYFPALTTTGSRDVITPGWVAINASGQVFVGAGNNAFVSLDNISFNIEPNTLGEPPQTSTGCTNGNPHDLSSPLKSAAR